MAPGRVARWYEMHLLDELGAAARGGPLRRVRPGPRGRGALPLGAAAGRRPVRALSRVRRTIGPASPSRRSSSSRRTSASTSRPSPRCAWRRRRARDRGRAARIRPGRARARRPLAGVPRRGPDGAADAAEPADAALGRGRRCGRCRRGRGGRRGAGRRPGAGRADRGAAVRHGRPPPYGASDRARELHAPLWVADLHADSLLWGRDLLERGDRGQVDVPRLRRGQRRAPGPGRLDQVAAPPQPRAQRRPQRRHRPPRPRRWAGRRRRGGACCRGRSTWRPGRRVRGARRTGAFRIIRTRADLAAYEAARAADPAADGRASSRSRAPTRSTATRRTSRSSPTPASG